MEREIYNHQGDVSVRIIQVQPGEDFGPKRHAAQHSLIIPLSYLKGPIPYEMLVGYLLHHCPPNQYYSLHSAADTQQQETFVQLLWGEHRASFNSNK